MAETPLSRLLLEAHRSLGGELLEGLSERGYPDVRAGHAALFMTIDRRTGTRLTELARRARDPVMAAFTTSGWSLIACTRKCAVWSRIFRH